MAEIAKEFTSALMDEKQQIAIGVAYQIIHRRRAGPDGNHAIGILQQTSAFQRRTGLRCSLGIERARAQRPLERGPAGGCVAMVKMGRGTKETVAADLPLEGALRQIRMRLARGLAFDAGEFDPVAAHALASFSTPRRIWSASMLSNRARKLPSPKPSLPLRWMSSKK